MTVVFAVAMAALAAGALLPLRAPRAGAAVTAAGCALLVVVGLDAALGGGAPHLALGDWLGFGPSGLRADGLSALFLALTGLTGGATALAYAERPPGRGLATLNGVLILGVAVAIAADQGFLFLLAWEGLTVCLYLIASADRDRTGALQQGYLTGGLTKVGGGALLAAFGLLYGKTGTFSLAEWAQAAPALAPGTRGLLFVLLLIAFGTKVGLLPLQGALPAGYGAAPRAGAASLSVALCAGFYGIWRFVFATIGPAAAWWGDVLLVLGALTAIGGILYAITQDDLRRFLGFSTVEHAGIALVGFGVALLGQAAGNRELAAAGLLAATLHVTAHNLAKTLALLVADRLERATGQRELDRLGGLQAALPRSATGLGLASLTLAAVPPLGGFVSEWFTFEALLQGFRLPELLSRLLCALAAAALALTAGLGLLAFAKLVGFALLGQARQARARIHEPGPGLGVLALGVVVAGLGTVAPWEIHLLGAGLQGLLGFDPATTAISHPLVLGPVFEDFSVLAPTWLSLVLPAYALLAAGLAWRALRPAVRRAPVWVTGSGAPPAAVQYRPASYSNPIRVVLRGLLGYRSVVRRDGDVLALDTRVVLAVDRFVYRPLAAGALALAARVRRSQSGRLGAYLLYMLAVLVVVLVLIPIL
jgi:hydrogenase-4 component B